jgi:hypothetical protein
VAGHRHFEAAAKRCSMNSGEYRFGSGLDPRDDVGEVWLFGRAIEFADVGARDEGPAGAYQHDRGAPGICLRFIEAPHEPLPDRLRQGIDRRIFYGYYRYRSVALQTDGAHLFILLSLSTTLSPNAQVISML